MSTAVSRRKPLTRSMLLCLSLLSPCTSAVADSGPAITFETRVLTGTQVPGAAAGVILNDLDFSSINASGDVAFFSQLVGPGLHGYENNQGVFTVRDGVLSTVARTGETLAGLNNGGTFEAFRGAAPSFNSAGDTAFIAAVDNPPTSPFGAAVLKHVGGSLQVVAQTSTALPGTGGAVEPLLFNHIAMNNAGQTVFQSETTGQALLSEGSGTLSVPARSHQQAVGFDPGLVYADVSVNTTVINASGATPFTANIASEPNDLSLERVLYLASNSGTVSLLARGGEQAADAPAGVNYLGFDVQGINDADQLLISAILKTGDPSNPFDSALYRVTNGQFSRVTGSGDAAPGEANGVGFVGAGQAVINGRGQIGFTARLEGPGVVDLENRSIYLETDGVLTKILREGDQVSGTADGTHYYLAGDTRIAINGRGQIALHTLLRGSAVGSSNNEAIFATGLDGTLRMLLRKGDLFDINDDPLIEDLRVIDELGLVKGSGGQDGQATSFNDSGQLAFNLLFTDGSEGIFVANVPEPTSLALLGLGGLLVSRRRRG